MHRNVLSTVGLFQRNEPHVGNAVEVHLLAPTRARRPKTLPCALRFLTRLDHHMKLYAQLTAHFFMFALLGYRAFQITILFLGILVIKDYITAQNGKLGTF